MRSGIPWPSLDSGQLALDDDTFRSMAKAYPAVSPLRELRHALSEMRLNNIPVGSDGRNRTLISPFSSRTGRNQPSNSRFLFGTATWLRGLIKPTDGMAIAYLDFSSQEIAIAAALSGDEPCGALTAIPICNSQLMPDWRLPARIRPRTATYVGSARRSCSMCCTEWASTDWPPAPA
ncbi:hypothetical protein MES5069_350002 [Mesorhizobium escarrei]|uniref:DNA-directed DNA polymerase family A palm domain-containing protein n=1 Tax=Mesorhizobium escarrei TaxID=666018 RepID=A0ABM9E0U9_9HYPH|nr:hypothetical protein MES5069_350002 [Mesorhizobium escarrei]